MTIKIERLKEVLIGPGHVNEVDFNEAKRLAEEKNIEIERLLVEKGYIEDENLGKIIAEEVGVSFIKLEKSNIEDITDDLLEYIPESVARSQRAIVFNEEKERGIIRLATSKPNNYEFIKNLEKTTGAIIEVYYATPLAIDMAIRKYGGDLKKEATLLIEEVKKNPEQAEHSIVKLVDLILEHAYANIASDVHIEPLREEIVVRIRVDGTLYKILSYPKEIHSRVVFRIKILSKLRTDETASPQDGRFDYQVGESDVMFIRVSILPTTEGENIVMRLLIQQGKRFSLESVGLCEDDLKKLKRNAKKPWGMIMVVGPTGSGKTTTLYAVLQLLNESSVNIMTVEDPVEYNIDGVQQSQVNISKNLTFSSGLRAIVRQDPDVIMVGEIRDEETVNMAVDASMTGHMVLSTMHANDAATAFPRLLEMGVETFLVASSVNISIAQRLVKKICEQCRESYFLQEEDIKIIEEETDFIEMIQTISGKEDIRSVRFFRGKGCEFCKNTGYNGRTAVFELLEVTENLRKLIIEKSSADTIKSMAVKEGMMPMVYDGISKALLGTTTISEIKRVVK